MYMSNIYSFVVDERVCESEVETSLLRQAKTRRSERFLKGPIPLKEITTAASLPGKSLALLLAIHYRIDLTGRASITLPSGLLAEMGISRDAKARGLKQLVQAGLIRVTPRVGRAAQIELETETKKDTRTENVM
jgi:DNA-binding MarR family transcriptional regulator